jgi:hypothetical protein
VTDLPDNIAANNIDNNTHTVTLTYKQYLKKLSETREHEWALMEERCRGCKTFTERQLLIMSTTCAALIVTCIGLLIALVTITP